MGYHRTVSEINGDFSRKSQIPPVYFAPPLNGFPLELGIGARGQKSKMVGLPDGEISLTISSAVLIQYANMTDRRTNSEDRASA